MKTILLIEDNDGIRENTAEILELTGYRVLTAENGKVGIEKALETRPDLVICDIMMPVLDGYGVLHIVNKNPQLAGIPFIFLTAKTERVDFRRGMELGADDYLTKPFDESELLSAIEGRLKRLDQLSLTAPEPTPPADKLHPVLAGTGHMTALADRVADRKVHAVRRKQFIYTEGDDPARLYFLKSGNVKIVRDNADGKELITNLYGPGDCFGYLALLTNTPHTDSAVALDDTELIYVPADEFQQVWLNDQRVAQPFLRLLAEQLGAYETQLVGMAYNSLRRRVADALLRLQPGTDADPAPIQLSRDELASVVGTATESLIRILSEFRQDGLIEQTGGGIRILQPDKLHRANW